MLPFFRGSCGLIPGDRLRSRARLVGFIQCVRKEIADAIEIRPIWKKFMSNCRAKDGFIE